MVRCSADVERHDLGMKTAAALVLVAVLIGGGLILGALIDFAWYFRLIPFGIGLVIGALLVRHRHRQ